MEAVRSKWTDERMDDLANRMDAGFVRVDEDLRAIRTDTRAEFGLLRAEVNSRFDSMQRTMFGILGSIVVGFLVTNL